LLAAPRRTDIGWWMKNTTVLICARSATTGGLQTRQAPYGSDGRLLRIV